MDIQKIRKDFLLLQRTINNKPIVYFDNACQSLRPKQVIEAIQRYYLEISSCAGRSNHRLAQILEKECSQARERVAKFIEASRKEEIIFLRNTTEGINLIANTFPLRKGDVVVTSDKEHNSNLIPWQILKKRRGIRHEIVKSAPDNTFDITSFLQVLEKHKGRVKLVSMVYTSNLDGVTIPVKKVIEIAHQFGARVLLDAAQTAPHQKINVRDLDVDFLVFSGHKMLGPSGIGVLYGKYAFLEELEPFLVGGDTVEYSTYQTHQLLPPPFKFEAGLQNYAGIIGLKEAIKYIEKIGFDTIKAQEFRLNEYLTRRLLKFSQIKLIGPIDPQQRGGIISFTMKTKDIHQVALLLDEMANIMVRSGWHCVHSWFQAHNLPGSLRLSVYFYNTLEEAEIFIWAFSKVLKIL